MSVINQEPDMLTFKNLSIPGFERVVRAENKEEGFLSFISIHNTERGPALGGIRFFPYKTEDEALEDVLRLSKAMTYKSAMAGLALGGGKSVIVGDPKKPWKNLFLERHAEAINSLKGGYIGAGDVGTSQEDIDFIHEFSPHIVGTSLPGCSGEPSRFTAWGVYLGMKEVAKQIFNDSSLKDKKIVIQGVGKVGMKLAEFLFWEGAELFISDIDPDLPLYADKEFGAKVLAPESILSFPCDILAPCALGAVLNKHSIPRLQCRAVAGAANNQLGEEQDGERLFQKGILYAPDFVINAGGIINTSEELTEKGYCFRHSLQMIAHIPDTLAKIFKESKEERVSPEKIAERDASNLFHSKTAR